MLLPHGRATPAVVLHNSHFQQLSARLFPEAEIFLKKISCRGVIFLESKHRAKFIACHCTPRTLRN
jgi:hypothetical protein